MMSQLLVPGELRTTKMLCLILLVFWICGLMFETSQEWIALVPGLTLSATPRFWALVTAGFYETSIIMGTANIAAVVLVGPVLEQAWGGDMFRRFVLFVNVATFCAVFCGAIVAYIATQKDHFLFIPMCGFSGVNAAFVVALFQRYPTRPILPISPQPTIQHLPIAIVSGAIALYVFGVINGKETPLVVLGTLFGWIFLRFFRVEPETGLVGDLRPEFAFVELFPPLPVLRPTLKFFSILLYNIALSFGFFAASVKSHQSLGSRPEANKNNKISREALSIASAADPTAERRRALAIRAIDEKLAALSQQGDLDIDDDIEIDIGGGDDDLLDLPSSIRHNAMSDVNSTAGDKQ